MIGHGVLMVGLVFFSAFFSGAETAFFNLSRRQIKSFVESTHKVQRLTGKILGTPRHLLGCLLLGNTVVNVLFFAGASVFSVKVERLFGVGLAAVAACGWFGVLVVFGEILPKSLAYTNSQKLSVAATVPVLLCMKVFAPVQAVLRVLVVVPLLRLILGARHEEKVVSAGEFKRLIEQVGKRGLISAGEYKLLGEVVELGFLKVRDVMRPRVDMAACEVGDHAEVARKIMYENKLKKLPVYDVQIDNIVGLVELRGLLLDPDARLGDVAGEVEYVPEQKTVESLLEFFRAKKRDMAVVVDEYGGIAGMVSLTDVAEELLGPIETVEGVELIEQLGPLEYRLGGALSIHDWAETFGINPAERRISTVAGLVTTLLGKIPKAGDVAYLKNLKFTVERVRKHRIESIILTLEPIRSEDE